MAFVFTLNKLKNGDTQINISEATRIPGTNKQRRNTIEKYHFSELQAKGYDPIIFIRQRINELKAQNKSNKELQTYNHQDNLMQDCSNNLDLIHKDHQEGSS